MLRTLFTFRGLILVFGLVALGLPIALVGQLGIVRTLHGINTNIAQIREGELAASDVLRLQLDEETGLREYAATRQPLFLEPYRRARAELPARLGELRARVAETVGEGEDRSVVRLIATNGEWLRTVAEPLLAGARDSRARQVRGKALVDRFRAEVVPVQAALDRRYRAGIAHRNRTIDTATTVGLVAISLIAFEAIVFVLVLARLQHELDRERGVVETLQTVASGRLLPPAHLALGTAYRSATRGARVGGDVYDVYRLDPDRTLLVIGDVSGKGLVAAVDTTFVRYAVRALAGEMGEPDRIVTRFDALYRASGGAPESFVTLFVGVHDRRDGSLTYANAGHEACWIRRGAQLEPLPPTGPLVGLAGLGEMTYAAAWVPLAPGDLLVLATDGLTEARDPAGGFVPAERLREWIVGTDAPSPQRFVDGLLAALTRYARGRTGDDLALLAVSPLGPRDSAEEEPAAPAVEEAG